MAYNFDEEDKFILFTYQGHDYQFWYPTTKQSMDMQKFADDNDKVDEFIMNQVKSVKEDSPEFKSIYKEMNVKQYAQFNKMIAEGISIG